MVGIFTVLIILISGGTALAMMWFVLHEPERPEPHITAPYAESDEPAEEHVEAAHS